MGIKCTCATSYFIARIFKTTTLCTRHWPRCSLAHEAFRSGLAPNKGMRHFAPNERRAGEAEAFGQWEASTGYCYSTSCWRGSPLQEGGAITRGPPNESRPRRSGPRPRRTKKERTNNCAPSARASSLVLRQLEHVVWLSDRSLDAGLASSRRWRWSDLVSSLALTSSHLEVGLVASRRCPPYLVFAAASSCGFESRRPRTSKTARGGKV